jgi:hypothetical protein
MEKALVVGWIIGPLVVAFFVWYLRVRDGDWAAYWIAVGTAAAGLLTWALGRIPTTKRWLHTAGRIRIVLKPMNTTQSQERAISPEKVLTKPERFAHVSLISFLWRLHEPGGSCYFDFQVKVGNASPYLLVLGTRVEGNLVQDGTVLLPPPAVNERPKQDEKGVQSGGVSYVQLRQDLTVLGPIKDRLRAAVGNSAKIGFRDLTIISEYRDADGKVVASFPLELSGAGPRSPYIHGDIIPAGRASQWSAVADALEHVTVEGARPGRLVQQRAFNPWRVAYPIFIRNGRSLPVRLTGFNATVLWDYSEIQRIEWRAPNVDMSNGLPIRLGAIEVPGFDIQGDHDYTLDIPLNARLVGNFPQNSPSWQLRGTVYFQAKGESSENHFNGSDNYCLSQSEWEEWKAQYEKAP